MNSARDDGDELMAPSGHPHECRRIIQSLHPCCASNSLAASIFRLTAQEVARCGFAKVTKVTGPVPACPRVPNGAEGVYRCGDGPELAVLDEHDVGIVHAFNELDR
jgi:hypothetical protein